MRPRVATGLFIWPVARAALGWIQPDANACIQSCAVHRAYPQKAHRQALLRTPFSFVWAITTLRCKSQSQSSLARTRTTSRLTSLCLRSSYAPSATPGRSVRRATRSTTSRNTPARATRVGHRWARRCATGVAHALWGHSACGARSTTRTAGRRSWYYKRSCDGDASALGAVRRWSLFY